MPAYQVLTSTLDMRTNFFPWGLGSRVFMVLHFLRCLLVNSSFTHQCAPGEWGERGENMPYKASICPCIQFLNLPMVSVQEHLKIAYTSLCGFLWLSAVLCLTCVFAHTSFCCPLRILVSM